MARELPEQERKSLARYRNPPIQKEPHTRVRSRPIGRKDLREETLLPEVQLNPSLEDVISRLRRIATVVNGISETPDDWREATSKLVFEKEYVDGLFGLDRLKRIWVIFGFHRHRGWTPRVRPRRATDDSLVGILASRGIQRPNKLGLTLVDLVSVEGNVVTVRGLDAFDGSPVYDVKNYDEDYDDCQRHSKKDRSGSSQ